MTWTAETQILNEDTDRRSGHLKANFTIYTTVSVPYGV